MTVTLTGKFGLPLKHLQSQVAASATFQTATGAADATAAAAYVISYGADDREEISGQCNANYVPPPRAIAWLRGGRVSQNAHNVWQWANGHVEVRIELPISEDSLQEETGLVTPDGAATFLNTAGAIFGEILELANTGGYLSLRDPEILAIAQEYTDGGVPKPVFVLWFTASFQGQF